ncbi:hypothetical protein LINPERHAP2_LOCUS9567 [Linum perenne]
MTNVERARRHMSTTDAYEACQCHQEDVEHVLRSCRVSKEIWSRILPEVVSAEQLLKDFQSWWIGNIGDRKLNPLFGFGAWLIWKMRNMFIFENTTWSAEEVSSQDKFWSISCRRAGRLVNWVEKRRV